MNKTNPPEHRAVTAPRTYAPNAAPPAGQDEKFGPVVPSTYKPVDYTKEVPRAGTTPGYLTATVPVAPPAKP